MDNWQQLRSRAVETIRRQTDLVPEVALILGSGLGELADEMTAATVIPYREIPGFPPSTVAGHAGELWLGTLEGVPVVAMKGRFHYYEGHSMQTLAHPVRVMRALGAHTLLATNATGGLNPDFQPGDLMVVTDHLNMMGANPLTGPNDDELGPRFPDMAQAYPRRLRELALRAAAAVGVPLRQGVYVACPGPVYETRFTHLMYRRLGCDAVGMSLVPEVIAAVHCGMETLGISAITDVIKEEGAEPLTHEEVMSVADGMRPRFIALVKAILPMLPPDHQQHSAP